MGKPTSASGLRQAEMILALSLATDLGTGRPMEWAMRSTLLGMRLGEKLGFDDSEMRDAYHCSLLMYIGCTSEIGLALQLFGDDHKPVWRRWTSSIKVTQERCWRGCSSI